MCYLFSESGGPEDSAIPNQVMVWVPINSDAMQDAKEIRRHAFYTEGSCLLKIAPYHLKNNTTLHTRL